MKCSSAIVAARLAIGGLRLGQLEPLEHLRLELGEVVAGVGGAAVERQMLAAVDHFLRGEGLDFAGQPLVGPALVLAHALDEERLAFGEGRRQPIV